uniref:(northern house mosquito) hypothetical protein n=2 Tax=Culex pipiens TaxID=7175 RepID=A0A8D8BB67_CULPI
MVGPIRSSIFLMHHNLGLDVIISADALWIILGVTINHRLSDGSVKVVQHASRALANSSRRTMPHSCASSLGPGTAHERLHHPLRGQGQVWAYHPVSTHRPPREPDEDYVIAAVTPEDEATSSAFESFDVFPLSFQTIRDMPAKSTRPWQRVLVD